MQVAPASTTPALKETSAIQKCVNILMLFFPLTSFLLIPTIQGTTIITMFAGLLAAAIVLMPANDQKVKFIYELVNFLCLIATLSIISQLINLLVNLKLPPNLILINLKEYTKTFFRASHLTQSLELVVGYTIYLQVKYFADASIIKYIFWGLRLLCIYGLYEFVFYLVFHQNGDFIANRTFGDEKSGSLFQTINIGGISLMRIKGYTGEPSMFVYTAYPFWVLAVALKRKFDAGLLLVCLVFTFSTTAYFCILLFLVAWMYHQKQFRLIFYCLILVAITCVVLQLDAFQHLFDSVYNLVFADKVSGGVQSSKDRMTHLIVHLNFWSGLSLPNQVFGIGFGYVRSTDFFSTVLVNCGVFGFVIFSLFFYKRSTVKLADRTLEFCYKTGLLLLYMILMLTVPEFSYPSLWIFLGLSYVLVTKARTIPLNVVYENANSAKGYLLGQA